MNEVRWTRGFWADRFELCRTQMVPSMARLMEGTNYSQFYCNFEIAAGVKQGEPHGATFNDGDFYKFLEGAAATLAVTNDPRLDRELDQIISVIAEAQETNGYLDTWVQLHQHGRPGVPRVPSKKIGESDPSESHRQDARATTIAPFSDPNHFEMYNFGHLMTAACMHYRATGKTNFLTIARKAADFLCNEFKNPTPELARNAVCPSHYMGLVELYRATGDSRYLELARRLFAMRDLVKDGTADNQDWIRFQEQTEAQGHAVRANYLYAGAADLFMETGDASLLNPLMEIWTNVVTKKMYITGGCGALYDGAAPYGSRDQRHITRVHQAYGYNYQLPNTTAYNETCANIGNVLWNWRMFLATGQAKFMDIVELALYNSVLSGGGLDGTNFFYTNPLRVTDPMPVALRWSRTRVPFYSSFCCPPNLVRTIAESANYAYAKTDDAIWVNLYGGSRLETTLRNGEKVILTQNTEYPWNGLVRLRIVDCGNRSFALKLRIPGWAKDASVRINDSPIVAQTSQSARPVEYADQHARTGLAASYSTGQVPRVSKPLRRASQLASWESRDTADLEVCATPGGYLEIHRVWHPGDFVDLNLSMPVRVMEANPLVEEDLNQVAIERGPIVYCLESPDLPSGVKVSDVCIPADINLRARYDRRLLDGIVVLEGRALERQSDGWSGQLYREAQRDDFKPISVKFIPYCVWQNRGPSEMTVWLPKK